MDKNQLFRNILFGIIRLASQEISRSEILTKFFYPQLYLKSILISLINGNILPLITCLIMNEEINFGNRKLKPVSEMLSF